MTEREEESGERKRKGTTGRGREWRMRESKE